jgi:hypothetical protein
MVCVGYVEPIQPRQKHLALPHYHITEESVLKVYVGSIHVYSLSTMGRTLALVDMHACINWDKSEDF